MVVQARARATRQKFIDAAVDLFDYYFPTKESVVAAIFEQADARCEAALTPARAATSPLEFLIRMTFVVAETTQYDKVVRIGNLLRQSWGRSAPSRRKRSTPGGE